MKRKILALISSAVISSLIMPTAFADSSIPRPQKTEDVLGVVHEGGYYAFTDTDYLNEGADKILEMGSKTIKVWLHPKNMSSSYYLNSPEWGSPTNLQDLIKHKYFKDLLDKPFNTYIFSAYEYPLVSWQDGMTADEVKTVEGQFYETAKYLLTEYKGTNKTFVFQNWEGDGALQIQKASEDQREVRYQGMADWLNARQDGITRAREEVGMDGVYTVGCAEFNWIPSEAELASKKFENSYGENVTYGYQTVVPRTHMDLYSFSSWGTNTMGEAPSLKEKLEKYAEQAPDSELYGAKNIMLGEFGAKENLNGEYKTYPGGSGYGALAVVQEQLKAAIDFGVVYAMYWEMYCNGINGAPAELKPDTPSVTDNKRYQGVWLIRADGSITPTYEYFKRITADTADVYDSEGNTLYNPAEKKPGDISVYIDKKPLLFTDQEPVLMNDRTMVPMRRIFEAYDAEVEWNQDTWSIRATRGDTVVELTIGDNIIRVNGEEKAMDVAPLIMNSRTLVPLRFVSEALGCDVQWIQETNSVELSALPEIIKPNDAAVKESIKDDMTTFDNAYMHSSNWTTHSDSNNPDVDIKARIYRNSPSPEFVQYALNTDIKTFNIMLYAAKEGPTDAEIVVYASKDGNTWDKISYNVVDIKDSTAKPGFKWCNIVNPESMPTGYRHLKIECVSRDRYFPQVARVEIN
ncbi:MAG: copper amine oxidase N-terminal domain-containing protein [Clostridia bacterium]|nr:copper amine oxidase N-terminal domain-containing protein [Clostridia bacterium]